MKNVILALAFLVSTPSSFAAELLETLKPHAGLYQLEQNNPKNPCRGGSNFEAGSVTRLNVFTQAKSDDFFTKGDTILKLEQLFDDQNVWASRFDHAPFTNINKGTKRQFIPPMPLVISHQTIYDAATDELTHSATISTLEGRGEGVQTIKFMGNDSFLYTYVINERNALGMLLKSVKAGECEFSRKQ